MKNEFESAIVNESSVFESLKFYCESLEPAHEYTYNKACATSVDSDQPAHPRSLIRVFADPMFVLQPQGYPKPDKKRALPY